MQYEGIDTASIVHDTTVEGLQIFKAYQLVSRWYQGLCLRYHKNMILFYIFLSIETHGFVKCSMFCC